MNLRILRSSLSAFVATIALGAHVACAGDASLGLGANYWRAVEDVDGDFDDNGLSYLLSYQYMPGPIGFDLQVEMLPDLFGEDAYSAQAYVVAGSALYVAAGVGVLNLNDEWLDDPFYALRAGLNLQLVPGLLLDISGNYRFNEEVALDDAIDAIDTDTVFIGAALRIEL